MINIEPRIQYAQTADGVSIAFWTLGEGTPLVIMPAFPYSHIQLEWQFPEMRRWYERLAPSLEPFAYSPDGLVEAMESREHRWVVAVQWHPERPEMRPAADALFAAFVAACAALPS